jgi:agmatine deiminase
MATPDALGYRMPAEWETHLGTWLTWPRREGISFPEKFDAVLPIFAQVIRHLVQVEQIDINVWNAENEAEAQEFLLEAQIPKEMVHFHHFPAYEPWCRDHGPIFLVRESHGKHERAIVDWEYNAWGGKYPMFDLDDKIPQHVAALRGLPLFSPGIVLEGGAIDVNGRGTLLTTESCLLNRNRNPHLSQKEIAKFLRDYLGVRNVIWLNEGIVGDDTDGHVDDLARFVNPTTVVTSIEENLDDANHQALQENLLRLRMARDQDGRLLRIVKLPMPGFVEHQGQRLPASYANFYIANNIVLVPTFRSGNDAVALEILQKEFPNRRVIGLDCTELIWGLGSLHCITQQEPA